jgi:hypothetical protein
MPVIPKKGSTLYTSTFTFSRGAFDAAFFALDAVIALGVNPKAQATVWALCSALLRWVLRKVPCN